MVEPEKKNNEDPRVVKTARKKYPYILTVAIVILIAIATGLYWSHSNKKLSGPSGKVVFTVNGTAYTENEVKAMIAYPLGQRIETRDALTKQAFNYLKREQMAQMLNIVPTNYAIKQAELIKFGPKLSSQLNSSSWIRFVSYDWALQQSLAYGNLSQYQGYSLIFWFGQHLETGPVFTAPDFGNTQLIASDRAYAQGRANYYYQELTKNKMSASAVYQTIQKDPKLSFALPNNHSTSLSRHFIINSQQTWSNQVGLTSVINYIAGQSEPGLSQIRTGNISIVNNPNPSTAKDYANGYYYIVDLDVAKKAAGITVKSFSKDVSNEKAQYIGW